MVLAAESALIVALLVAGLYGPPLYACRQLRESGRFYYGDTLRGCVQQKVSTQYEALDAFVTRVTRRS